MQRWQVYGSMNFQFQEVKWSHTEHLNLYLRDDVGWYFVLEEVVDCIRENGAKKAYTKSSLLNLCICHYYKYVCNQ